MSLVAFLVYIIGIAISTYFLATFLIRDEIAFSDKYHKEVDPVIITAMALLSLLISVLWPLFPFFAALWLIGKLISKAAVNIIEKEKTRVKRR